LGKNPCETHNLWVSYAGTVETATISGSHCCPCSCDLLVLDKTSGEYPLTVNATINGTNAVEGQIDWGEGAGWEAAPGFASSHVYNNAGTFSVKARVKGLDSNWYESTPCAGEVKVKAHPQDPVCLSWIVKPTHGDAPLGVWGDGSYSDPSLLVKISKVYWGDGSVDEGPISLPLDDIAHTYKKAGTFTSRLVLVKEDGTEIGSLACEAKITVKEEENFVPEPGTSVLLGGGLTILVGYVKRRLRK
jgi:PKD repeat protein